MKLLTILASVLLLGLCVSSDDPPPRKARSTGTGPMACSYPSWMCDCKVYYDCENDGEFPQRNPDPLVAGVLHNLAPSDYPLAIPGKRWRRNEYNQEKFCRTECRDRLNAFLTLKDGELSSISYSAACIKLLSLDTSPFKQDGMDEPCCSIYLLYGREWCQEKWYVEMGSVRCLTDAVIAGTNMASGLAGGSAEHTFSVQADCPTDGVSSYGWCTGPPICPK